MAVRDFDPTQLSTDFDAILSQAGITFSYLGASVTGVWSSSRDAFADFENHLERGGAARGHDSRRSIAARRTGRLHQ